MKLLIPLFVSVVLLAPLSSAQNKPWTPAEFRGLKLGVAKMPDVERVLGPAESKSYKSGSDILVYRNKGENQGRVELELRDGILFKVNESLPVAMPRTVAYRKYGKDYVERRYSAVNCWGRSGDDLLYRDPRGNIELLEYPQRGVLLWPDQLGYDIASVIYRAVPLASRKPKCVSFKGQK